MSAVPPDGAATAPDTGLLRRVAISGLLGTSIEYYDFLIYATMAALVFDKVFFPHTNPALATVASFGTLAAGYVARPLGGILFGHFGDRVGRKSMLVLSMTLMGSASLLIGVLPTYDRIGMAAPLLLVALRILQGIAIGGEWGGATLLISEHADAERRGFWNGILQMGSPIGGVLATVVLTVITATMSDDALMAWGWRIPYLLSVLLLIAGLYVRMGVTESPLFSTDTQAGPDRIPLARLLRQPRNLLLATAVGIGPFALTGLISTYMVSYATGLGYRRSDVVQGLLYIAIASLIVVPVFSALSDQVGRRAVVMTGAVGIIVFAWPLYALVGTGSVTALIAAMIVGEILQSLMYAPLGALLSELFGTVVRYTGVSVGYQLASLIGAGFTPLIASALNADGLSSTPLVALAGGCGLVTAVSIWRISETRGMDLAVPEPDTDIAARNTVL